MVKFIIGLIGFGVILFMVRAIQPVSDALFDIMNTTFELTTLESATWRFMPIVVPIIIACCVIWWMVTKQNDDGEE